MEIENPLQVPRMVWQVALVVTTVLVLLRYFLRFQSRRKDRRYVDDRSMPSVSTDNPTESKVEKYNVHEE